MLSKICPICKIEFAAKNSEIKRIYCSQKCFGSSFENKKITKKCPTCNKIFSRIVSKETVYCSRKCRGSSQKKSIVKHCETCKKEFVAFACRSSKRFCSKECHLNSIKKYIGDKIRCSKCHRLKNAKKFFGNKSSWCKLCVKNAVAIHMTTPHGRYKYSINQARRRHWHFEINEKEYYELIKLLCHYCGGQLSNKGVGLDRKDNNEHYTVDNSVPCCPRCNHVKGWHFSYEEMVWLSKYLVEIDKRRAESNAIMEDSK